MSRFVDEVEFSHQSECSIGVLLVNLGTPEAPTPRSVRRYLRQFLSDPRVVEFPRLPWWLILNLVILNVRPRRSAKAYEKIWTDDGSPLLVISKRQAGAVGRALAEGWEGRMHVELGMAYGEPSIGGALERLRAGGVRRLLVLPLYPQYSGTTTGSVFDAVTRTLQQWRWVPELRFVNAYHDHPPYVRAVADKIRVQWGHGERGDRLLFSFHGVPQRYLLAGDPYHCQCQKSARLIAEDLDLADNEWSVVFQSRFGREPWLKPYCDQTLEALPDQRVKSVDIVCPGFSADCLETLEEIAQQNRDLFLCAGGERYQYIPCLNDDPAHIDLLSGLVLAQTREWREGEPVPERQRRLTLARAQAMGAAR